MKLNFEKKENIDIVSLIGRLDGNTAPSAKDEIIEKLDENTSLIINMKNCEYVSSAGLRVLMIIAKTLKSKGGNGVLVEMNEEVGDVMEMTGFGNIFKSFNTIGEAFEFLQKGE
ncbi:STAS domain-containing protein [Fusobacteria bacterium ZRK30]|nr:STAS domain-containing protein [Fusobacteria bacterium ZRK30]